MPAPKFKTGVNATIDTGDAPARTAKSKVVAPRNPRLIRQDDEDDKQSPSAFLSEMSMTTAERFALTYEMRIPQIIELLDMSEMTHQKSTVVDIEEPLFQPFPSEIVYQNFDAHLSYKIPLQLRNNDKVARLVKVTQTASPYFNIISPPDVGNKVAPGMDTVFHIEFTPNEKKDYHHELICITEREKFLVPIRAVGARAILDFPDEVNFGIHPVKYEASKTLLVRNIGNREGKFNLVTKSPYCVSPAEGVLAVGECMQITINMQADTSGQHCSHLLIQYDTKEDIYVALFGSTIDVNVRLEESSIKLDNTFISSASQRTVTLSNKSDILVHFTWKPYATAQEDKQERQGFHHHLMFAEEQQKDSFLEECISDPTLRDQFSLLSRRFKNKHTVVDGDKLIYNDDIIQLDPLEGDIWPHSSVDITVIFKPVSAEVYQRTIYCDVTGRELRLPLKINGEGIGPIIYFSFDTLDIENVFVNSQHSYEVIISNKGDIDAVFQYVPSETLFGQQFFFTPSSGIIRPGDYQAVQIHFSSPHLGEFHEVFNWLVDGSPNQFSVAVQGCVIGPTFHFDTPKLKFGTISYGFMYEKTCSLVNTSLIPMTFRLRVPTDGSGVLSSSVATGFLEGSDEHEPHPATYEEPPQEFEVYPDQGILMPQSEIDIQIMFTPLAVSKYEKVLVVDVEGVGNEILALPMSAKCTVPNIAVLTPILDFGKCFLGHPYQRMIDLQNESDLHVKYQFVKQCIDDNMSGMLYSSSLPRGIIEPQSVLGVPLQIEVETVNQVEEHICLLINGMKHKPLQVKVYATGEGPVLHIKETEIEFGVIPVLQDTTHYIQVVNESLIPAHYNCEMVRPRSLFHVEPKCGVISPESMIRLKVTARVNDSIKFQDKLQIDVRDSQVHSIHLSAKGSGTTIVTEPAFSPVWDIGPFFSNTVYRQVFKFTNNGRKIQQVYWMTEGFSTAKSRKKPEHNPEDMKFRTQAPPIEPPKQIFRLIPDRMSLAPGVSQDVILEGFSDTVQEVSERMLCQAIVGCDSGKEKIMKVEVKAKFIQPLIQFSERELNFSVMALPDMEVTKESQELKMCNISMLPLMATVTVEYPFQFIVNSGDYGGNVTEVFTMDLSLDLNKSIDLLIQFDPAFEKDRNTCVVTSRMGVVYHDHPNTEHVELSGTVFYPNLQFERTAVQFESILNDTEHVQTVRVTNESPIDVHYEWSFLNHEICFEGKEEDEGLGKEISSSDSDEENMKLPAIQKFHTTEAMDTDQSDTLNKEALENRPSTAPATFKSRKDKEITCSAIPWSQVNAPPVNIAISEVYDILPLFGCLKPNESQQLQFSFYGHAHIMADATAVCSVWGGPDYQISLHGQASLVQYRFSSTEIDVGRQFYDQVSSQDIQLTNDGKVDFDFTVLDADSNKTVSPGDVNIFPGKGIVKSGGSVTLTVKYLSSIPEKFHKTFKIRVAHFGADTFTIHGEGVFPRVVLSLPRDLESPHYEKRFIEARDNLLAEKALETSENGPSTDEFELYDWDIQSEIDRLDMRQFALDLSNKKSDTRLTSGSTDQPKKKKPKAQLIDYVLDFGHVVYGTTHRQACRITNTGHFPVSFIADHRNCTNTGFFMDLDRVKGLPGFPDNEGVDFCVTFNTHNANLTMGVVDVQVPIRLTRGPIMNLRLKADIAMPDVQPSLDAISFGHVLCGQCKVVTMQLYNEQMVRCDWTASLVVEKKETNKHIPMHMRKKMKAEKPKPKIIEMMPPTGSLLPGQRLNVQVKFMPLEETSYTERLQLTIAQSTRTHQILCTGRGLEPALDFEQTMLTFGPILPHSGKDMCELRIVNPCTFPVEFYSIEFDGQYLEEEKILQALPGYDEYSTLLMPPRQSGDGLPSEFTAHYGERERKMQEKADAEAAATTGEPIPILTSGVSDEKIIDIAPSSTTLDTVIADAEVGDLELTPVSTAIARYLGIDLTAEGRAARNRRGIVIVVHGAPLSGKSATAKDLAARFDTALLTIDDVVTQALQNGVSAASVRTRELCATASRLAHVNSDIIAAAEASKPTTPQAEPIGAATLATVVPVKAQPSRRTTVIAGDKKAAKAGLVPTSVSTQSPLPPAGPVSRKLDVKCNVVGVEVDEEYYSCTLPEDLLVELLSDKLQDMADCQKGVVFDGLESMFVASEVVATNVLLRATNNRKYIYNVALKLDFDTLSEYNLKKKLEKEHADLLAAHQEWQEIDEMEEEDYEKLTEEQQVEVERKRLAYKRERVRKQKEQKSKLEQERKEREEMEARLAEEEKNKKGKRTTVSGKGKDKEPKDKKSNDKLNTVKKEGDGKASDDKIPRPASNLHTDETTDETDKKKAGTRLGRQKSPHGKEAAVIEQIDEHMETDNLTEEEKELKHRFQWYEQSARDAATIFEMWDRTTGGPGTVEVVNPEVEPEIPLATSASVAGKQKGDRKKTGGKDGKDGKDEKLKGIAESPALSTTSLDPADEEEKVNEALGIPVIIAEQTCPQISLIEEILKADILPLPEEVMEGIGIGSSGPPIPPPASFAVVSRPVVRPTPLVNEFGQHYMFIAPEDRTDLTTIKEEVKPEPEPEKPLDKKQPKKKQKQKQVEETERQSRLDRAPSASKQKGRGSSIAHSPPPPVSPVDDGNLPATRSLGDVSRHRWSIPAGESTILRIQFQSTDLGQFDQTLNFEIVGTCRRYQIFCRGICTFPTISREPRIVFPNRKKFRKPDEIVHKKYILGSETFEFGPLLAGKNRERYREGRYPENMERIVISNTSLMPADISFGFLNDANATTFMLEPPTMLLQPGESQPLTMWAYPKVPDFYEDQLVCCVKENPEPVLFKVNVHGVRPALELDSKTVSFDRVLIHRKETRTLYLRNSTLLPIAWKLNGMENLGDDFSLTVEQGTIEPKSEFGLQMHFRAMKANSIRRVVRLEVSDAANVMGLAHAENINVQAEAYDVQMDLSFPKGTEGGIDYGTMRVGDESKQTCSLKNKGRYEIAFNFIFDENSSINYSDLFVITPSRGNLIPGDRPTQVQVLFKSKAEISVKDQVVIKCQIIEPSLSTEGEIIACIPVKVTAKSVYSKYSIYPTNDINFGAVLVNTKKTRTFVIENKGEFDFRYTISKINFQLPPAAGGGLGGGGKLRGGNSVVSAGSRMMGMKTSRRESLRGADAGGGALAGGMHAANQKLVLGMFTMYPASGVVSTNGNVTVTVDMLSEIPLSNEEEFVIDISERSPLDHPTGIEYRLLGEACLPSITNLQTGIATIFEEHRVVKNLNVFRYHTKELPPGSGVYGEDENRFIFYNVIVGHKAKARFKIINPNKVPCDVIFAVKPLSNKGHHKITDVYDIQPQRSSIPAHSSVFTTVTFHPPSMQQYQCIYEASIEGLPSNVTKTRNLTFEIQGDGNLPRVSVLKPITTNSKGNPVILFNRLLVNRAQLSPVVLKNDGTLACTVCLTLVDPNMSFVVTKQTEGNDDEDGDEEALCLATTSSKPVSATLQLNIDEVIKFYVEFSPKSSGKVSAEMRVSVQNNPFEDSLVQLIGEGYEEEVTLDNIHSNEPVQVSDLGEQIDETIVTVPSSNRIGFGDCEMNAKQSASFTITNHSKTETIRFAWDTPPEFTFAPHTGHLKPCQAKDVQVTFVSEKPTKIEELNIPCRVEKITMHDDKAKGQDWDSRKRIVKWVDVEAVPSATLLTDENGNAMQTITQRPAMKRKVIETEAEPAHSIQPGTETFLELFFSANVAFAKFSCNIDRVYFHDTCMFQTRVHKFVLKNEGDVRLSYDWKLRTGLYRPPEPSTEESSGLSPEPSKGKRKGTPNKPLSGAMQQRQQANAKKDKSEKGKAKSTDEKKDDILAERSGSSMALGSDGRPASVMSLVYEAGAVFSNISAAESQDMPFTIEPRSGVILAADEQSFTVRFSPLECVDFNAILSASIPNLDPDVDSPPLIAVHGLSVLPWCHFELDESNYISDQRNPELRGPNGAPAGSRLDSNTKVLEFKACGINTKVVRKFFVLNPTDTPYNFSFELESSNGSARSKMNSAFLCLTEKRLVAAGKKTEIAFEYNVDSLELNESFWRFFIHDHNVSVPFLLVGYGNDPAIAFDHSHINFQQLLLGHSITKTVMILNDEDQPFSFQFEESSRHASGHLASLEIEPMKGIVPAQTRLPVLISYKAESEAEVNFNVVCNVKNKTNPLTLNIKCEGFSVNMQLVCENSTGEKISLTPKGVNQVDFGEVELNEKAIRYLFIENNGRFNIDFAWQLSGPSKPSAMEGGRHGDVATWTAETPPVSMDPLLASVTPNSRCRCRLTFCPPCKMRMKNCQLLLKIVNGPTYNLAITGEAVPPAVDLSFETHDFGACFIYRPGLPIQEKILHVKNVDIKPISLECQYENTKHLEVISTANMIAPGEGKDVTIRFYPRELKVYEEQIPFEVNGLSTIYVKVLGQGTEMDVTVAKHTDRKVNIGALQVNEKVTRPVRIVNNGLAPIQFSLTMTPSLTVLQNTKVLWLTPDEKDRIHMKTKASLDVIVHFQPRCRVPQFSEEIILECAGVSQPLFTISGSCQGLEIKFDSEAIPFGSVTLGSSSSRKLVMTNSGDIGAAFGWKPEQFAPAFSISPISGYISPGMEVPFEIVFKPNEVSQDIRYDDLKCTIENSKPLKLVLTGSCIPQLAMKEVITFQTHVRTRDTKTIALHNKTNQTWSLNPVIDGEFWSGADLFVVEPQQSRNYEIGYRPFTMTIDGKKQTGSVFFALPDGSGLLYNLTGTADPPKPIQNIQREVPGKTSFTEVLTVNNWLRKPQRFRVIMDMIKPEKPDPATSLKGLEYIDVPGLSKKEYKVNFYAHKEGAFSSKITFKNETTAEYQFFYVTFKASPPSTIACIELSTPVRQSAAHVLTIKNPLNSMVNFQTSCNILDVNLPPQFTVPPQSEGECTFEYMPLKSGTSAGRLTLQSLELGSYIYDLNLTATPAAVERPVHFRTNLGTCQVQACKFMNYSRARVEYACKIDNPDFLVEKSINAASASSGGSEVSVDVTFEPSRLGDSKATLLLTSNMGGEYTFPLVGSCQPPKPQGPYTIKAGSSTQIPFKNIFAQTTNFTFHTDNPCFTAKEGETIRAKKMHNIQVSFDGNQGDSKVVRMGRFVVTCNRNEGTSSNISWTFYLKGVTP